MTACLGQPHIDDRDAVIESYKKTVDDLLNENDLLRRRVTRLREALAPVAAKADMYGQNAFVPRTVMRRAAEVLKETEEQ